MKRERQIGRDSISKPSSLRTPVLPTGSVPEPHKQILLSSVPTGLCGHVKPDPSWLGN